MHTNTDLNPRTRIFTPARIVALVISAALVLGLTYLRIAPGDKALSVPAGAKADDLILEPCTYATENGRYAADCGALVVPENRTNPSARLIALPVTRIRARSAHPAEPVFRLEGGPGITNMNFSDASRIADNHDVVLVGYRGVDGSSVLDCPEVTSALTHSADFLGQRSMKAYSDAFVACADRLQGDGVDLAGYTLPQRVDDLEAARLAFGYDRIDLLSESAGTRTAMIYSWRHPASIHRSVMIGANPPGHFVSDPLTTDEQIRHYGELCSRDKTCANRTSDLAESIRNTTSDEPAQWLFLPIKKGTVRVATFLGLTDSVSQAGPLSAPTTLDSLLSADHGDSSGLWLMSRLADFAIPEAFVWGDVAAASRMDVHRAEDYFSSSHPSSIIGNPVTDFLWAGGRMVGAWPSNPDDNAFSQVRTTSVETLVIGGTVDFATPPQVATNELMPHLPNGHQVVLAELGHTTDFWGYQPDASSRLINTFFDKGQVDDSMYTHRTMDFGTNVAHTELAKIIFGTMFGFAVLLLLAMLWMPWRVIRRGSFGHKAGAVLRCLSPLVLGLGGWCLATMIVMGVWPGMPLDNELVAMLSVVLPAAVGVYWAWVHRDWKTTTKAIGIGVAAAGALLGAWFGFTSTAGLLAVVTAIVGAGVGANLGLLLFDIVRGLSTRDGVVAAPSSRASSRGAHHSELIHAPRAFQPEAASRPHGELVSAASRPHCVDSHERRGEC
ncbi:MAG: hypothetical protein QOE09_3128 [Ilumatobacteraceae bacterium]